MLANASKGYAIPGTHRRFCPNPRHWCGNLKANLQSYVATVGDSSAWKKLTKVYKTHVHPYCSVTTAVSGIASFAIYDLTANTESWSPAAAVSVATVSFVFMAPVLAFKEKFYISSDLDKGLSSGDGKALLELEKSEAAWPTTAKAAFYLTPPIYAVAIGYAGGTVLGAGMGALLGIYNYLEQAAKTAATMESYYDIRDLRNVFGNNDFVRKDKWVKFHAHLLKFPGQFLPAKYESIGIGNAIVLTLPLTDYFVRAKAAFEYADKVIPATGFLTTIGDETTISVPLLGAAPRSFACLTLFYLALAQAQFSRYDCERMKTIFAKLNAIIQPADEEPLIAMKSVVINNREHAESVEYFTEDDDDVESTLSDYVPSQQNWFKNNWHIELIQLRLPSTVLAYFTSTKFSYYLFSCLGKIISAGPLAAAGAYEAFQKAFPGEIQEGEYYDGDHRKFFEALIYIAMILYMLVNVNEVVAKGIKHKRELNQVQNSLDGPAYKHLSCCARFFKAEKSMITMDEAGRSSTVHPYEDLYNAEFQSQNENIHQATVIPLHVINNSPS